MTDDAATPPTAIKKSVSIDRLPPRAVTAVPLGAGAWTSRSLRVLSGKMCQALDLVLLGGVFLGLVAIKYRGHTGGTFRDLLQLRVSLRNIVIAGFCLGTWRVVLMTVGVYSPQRTGSVQGYLFRCMIGLNSCTGVVGLIEVVLGAGASVWQLVGYFWLLSFAALALARGLLIGFDRR